MQPSRTRQRRQKGRAAPEEAVCPGESPKHRKTVKRLLSYIQEEKYKLVLVFACVIINTVSMLAGSYMLRPIINGLTSVDGSAQKLLRSLLIMACIYLFGIVAQYLQARIMIGISQQAIFKIRNELFAKIQRLPVRFMIPITTEIS